MKIKNKVFWIILILMLLVLCFLFPYNGDDWAWGTSIGIDRLKILFKDYNGRWLGNLMVLVLTRSRLLRAGIISISMTLIVFILSRLINKKNNVVRYLIILLLLLIPVEIFAQAISWTSGFSNYVIPIIFCLIFIYFNKNIFKEEKINISNKMIVPFFIMGFSASLFIEHVTIYNLLLSIFSILLIFIKYKKVIISNVSYLFGSVSGTILMFSNGAYKNIFHATDTYRSIATDNFIAKSLNTYFDTIYKYLIENNVALNIFISIIFIIILYKALQKNDNKYINKLIAKISLIILFLMLSLNVFMIVDNDVIISLFGKYEKIILGIFVAIYFLVLFLVTWIFLKGEKRKQNLLYLISIIVLAAPLLFVTPLGPRCFFPTYVMFTLFAVNSFDCLNIYLSKDFIKSLRIIILIIMLVYISIFIKIFIVDYQRSILCKNNSVIENDILYLPKLPNEKYMWDPNPKSDVFIYRFKLFNHINDNQKIQFVDYDKWKKGLN